MEVGGGARLKLEPKLGGCGYEPEIKRLAGILGSAGGLKFC